MPFFESQHDTLLIWFRLRRRRPSQTLAVLFVLAVCLSLIGMEVLSARKAHDLQLQEASTATANMARALAQHADDTILAADTLLLGLVERLEVDGTAPAVLPRLQHLLRLRTASLASLNGIFVYDSTGRWIVNSQSAVLQNLNNADREYFKYHQSSTDRSAHIGAPVRSRSTHRWIIPISRRINHADGTFAGVALATIEMNYFVRFHDSFDIGENGTIFLAFQDGTLVLRRPFDDALLGKNVRQGGAFSNLRSEGSNTTMLTSKIDGVERLYSYRRLALYPLVVGTGLSRQEILISWRQAAYRSAAAIVLLIGFLLVVGLRLIRQISARAEAELKLREASSALEEMNRTLKMMSLQDSLTGLGNRRHFDLSLATESGRAMRNNVPLALIMIDVDYFKRFNDLYGHPAGDDCLRRISAAILLVCSRPGDIAARYGGEEIAVLLPQTDMADATAAAERIRFAVAALAIAHAGNPPGHVTASVGVAVTVTVTQTEGQLLKAADEALYAAKAGGRNRVCIGSVPMPHVPLQRR